MVSHYSTTKTVTLGLLSLALYGLLYYFEEPILRLTTQGEWAFVLPVLIAFAFSLVHGAFTGQFWDRLGIQAKPTTTITTPESAHQGDK
ncbi:MAG: hypothetical protein ACOY5C_01800 [Pseudomonadota bacterium]